ncbi:MAG: hypothetical protein M1816_006920 [Peltula sp. TS41687]|nr:MAG: hypothetical protein M1816_006920 [Peltula sp. TS41687]
MTYSLTEPTPLPGTQASKQGAYMRIGRGGAGNWVKPATAHKPKTAPAPSVGPNTSTSTTPALPKPAGPSNHHHAAGTTTSKYTSGRGGIGNAHTGERPMFFFDEELERIYSREGRTPPVYHIGRAGFGNRVGSVSELSDDGGVVEYKYYNSNNNNDNDDDGNGGDGDDDSGEHVTRAEEVRVSEDSRRSFASGLSGGRRSSVAPSERERQREREQRRHAHGGVWGRLSHTFSRGP